MVDTRLLKHLKENHLLSDTQSAYSKHHNRDDQLVFLALEIENAFQENKKVIAVSVDLVKAFSKEWQEELLMKLLKKEVEGKMCC